MSIIESRPNPNRRSRSIADVRADVTAVNTTAETVLATLAIPTTVATGDVLHIRATGDLFNNTGSGVNYTFKFIIGATEVLVSTTTGFSAGAARRKWNMDITVLVLSATSQRVGGLLSVGSASSTTWAANATHTMASGYNTCAEDLSAGKNAIVSAVMGTADANADCVVHMATLEIVKRASA